MDAIEFNSDGISVLITPPLTILDMKGQIYVTNAHIPYGCIHISALNGTKIGRISMTNPQLRNPHGIAIDLQDSIYVADISNVRVIKLLINGTVAQSYKTAPTLQYPYDVKT